jgi:hypothetical protein
MNKPTEHRVLATIGGLVVGLVLALTSGRALAGFP